MRFAYLNPYRSSAENQIFRSLRDAGDRMGIYVHECRNEVDIYACDPEFVLSVSTQLPKMTHHPAYLTLHEPKSSIFDLEARFGNILSYDGYLTISPTLTRFMRDFCYGVGRSEESGFFYLTPQQSGLAPDWPEILAAGGRKIAYFGTNWRRRMPSLMDALDKMDVLRIHGPRASWGNQNYRSYQGPVAFDGQGPQQVYAECGIGLVLMDERWVREDVISNRIFEISSVGAISICPDMPWIRNWFGDNVLYYDGAQSPAEIARQIRSNYEYCLAQPKAVTEKAAQARSIFEQHFSAEKMLFNLMAFHEKKKEQRKSPPAVPGPMPDITVVIRCGGRDAATIAGAVNSIRRQTFGKIQVLFAKYRDIDLSPIIDDHSGAVTKFEEFLIPGGGRAEMLYRALERVKTTYFAILDDDDQWLPDHIESLFAAGRRVSTDFDMAFSGTLDIDNPVDVGTHTLSSRSISRFGFRNNIATARDVYSVIHLCSMVARSDLLTPELLQIPDMRTAEDSVLVGILSRRSKPVFSYRPTLLYARNSIGGSNWEKDAERADDEMSLTLRVNLALSPNWIAGGAIAGAVKAILPIKGRLGRSKLGEHINRVAIGDAGWHVDHGIYAPRARSGQLFVSQSLHLSPGNYLMNLMVEGEPEFGATAAEPIGSIDIFVDDSRKLLTSIDITGDPPISNYRFQISDRFGNSGTQFAVRTHGRRDFTILSIGLHADSTTETTDDSPPGPIEAGAAGGAIDIAHHANPSLAENQTKRRGVKNLFKRALNKSGIYVSSMKSQRRKELLVLERDTLLSERDRLAIERNGLAADKDRLAAQLNDLNSERDMLFDERNVFYLERNALFGELETVFDLVLAANSGADRKGQLSQDVLALVVNGFKKGGFFVEFGATNGIDLSNTYILEKDYGWTGILAEPAPIWHKDLAANRNCVIDHDCVWSETGKMLDFDVVSEGEFSTISSFSAHDNHAAIRKDKSTFKVRTISLMDLLAKHGAPKHIDYMSVDTEGSEYEILSHFDFSAYRFNMISVEHNFTENRDRLKKLLEANGYRRICENASRWDDWYIPASSRHPAP